MNIADLFIRKGFNINVKNGADQTPLYVAAVNGNLFKLMVLSINTEFEIIELVLWFRARQISRVTPTRRCQR